MSIQTREESTGQTISSGETLPLSSNIVQIADTNFGHSISNIEEYSELEKAECQFLFQFPAMLIGRESECAAAILCRDDQGLRLVFLALNMERTEVSIFEECDVPEHLTNFTWSFANVLSVLPSSCTLTTQ